MLVLTSERPDQSRPVLVAGIFAEISAFMEMEPRTECLSHLFEGVCRLGKWVGWPKDFSNRAQLVLEEITMNVVMHSGNTDPIPIALTVRGNTLVLVVRDEGIPFDPTRDTPIPPAPTSFEELPIGGLGLPMVRSMVDRMHYRREGDINHLELTMAIESGRN